MTRNCCFPALEPGWPSAAGTPSASPGQTISLHGTPAYGGSAAGEATRRAAWAEHAVAQTRLEMIRAERNAARRSGLDEALAPLLEVAAPLRTSAERDALAAYACAISATHGTRGDLRGPAQRFSTMPAPTQLTHPGERPHAHTGLPGQRRVPRPPRGLPGLHARGTAQ